MAKEWLEKVQVKHHVSRSLHKSAYATTIYGKRGADTYVAREVFTTLTPKNIDSIWPKNFSAYCGAAWQHFKQETNDWEAVVKKCRGFLPAGFTGRLCFAHYQRWLALGAHGFNWPKNIKIPIRSVKLISVKDDNSVAPFAPGTKGFVKRTGFREVRIHLSEDGKSFVPVFVPYWKGDRPFAANPYKGNAIAAVRSGMVVDIVQPFGSGYPKGRYRIITTGQKQVRVVPAHLQAGEDIMEAIGLPKKGLQPYWPDFIRALGYESSHHPSAQA
jgi:hypothetical protein